ncbi:MAG TPA: GSCFA domain-containing protein [Parasegetibacter sp.]
MNFRLEMEVKKLPVQVTHRDKIMLIGSCFTDHMSKRFQQYKFNVLENPNGILFNPVSITRSVISYIENAKIQENRLVQLNGLWHSWDHHSRFSHEDKDTCIRQINQNIEDAHHFLKEANWLFITVGSAFLYELKPDYSPVANCHKAPADYFRKRLLPVEEVLSDFDAMLYRLSHFNPDLNILFTVSPVRHLRDGFIENNRSKAVLIQAIHHLVEKFDKLNYFPAYELVIDDLRDYRFYAEDMVHPNYQATDYVWEKLMEACLTTETKELIRELQKIITAANHKPFNPHSVQHKQFLKSFLEKTAELQNKYPYLDLSREMMAFAGS